MGDDHVEFVTRKIRKYGNNHHSGRNHGEITYAPVGHVAAEQSHLVAWLQAQGVQFASQFVHLPAQFGIGDGRAVDKRYGRSPGILVHGTVEERGYRQGLRFYFPAEYHVGRVWGYEL